MHPDNESKQLKSEPLANQDDRTSASEVGNNVSNDDFSGSSVVDSSVSGGSVSGNSVVDSSVSGNSFVGNSVSGSSVLGNSVERTNRTTIFEGSPYRNPEQKRNVSKTYPDLNFSLSPLRRAWLFVALALLFLAIILAPLRFDDVAFGAQQYLNVSKTENSVALSSIQQSIFEETRPATLQIEVLGPSLSFRYVQGMGTGFFISDDGLVLTAYHVIRSHKDSRFIAKDVNGRRYFLKLLAFDAHQDVALLKADTSASVPFLKLGNDRPRVGMQVMSIGNSRGEFLQARAGRIKRLNAKASRADFATDTIEFTSKLEAGDSGGPVLNAEGQVIGVVSYISFIPDDVLQQSKKLIPVPLRPLLLPPQVSSFAVPMLRSSMILEELLAGKKRDVPVIGIYGSDYMPGNAAESLGKLSGALVDHVPNDSPADLSGLRSCQLKETVLQQYRQPSQVVGCLGALGLNGGSFNSGSDSNGEGRNNRDIGNLRSQAGIAAADIIVAIDGERTHNFVEVINKIRNYNIGDEVILTVQRGNEIVDLVLHLGAEAHIFDQRF